MQNSSLENFKQDINNIREYIQYINLINKVEENNRSIFKLKKENLNSTFLETLVNKVCKKHNKENIKNTSLKNFIEHLHSFNREKKEFEYKAIIISLYGILENTISKWIQEHIKNVSLIVCNYDNLEDKFKIEHFNLSIKLISLITEKRHSKFDNIDKENILQKLNQSIISPNKFELNSEAYIPLSGNLKHTKVVEAFKPLNIDLNSLTNILHREIIKIDDLVGRRNDIAHGGQIDNILGISEFEDFISTLQIYMINIFDIIVEQEIKYHFQEEKIIYIDEPKEFYQSNTVCIINVKNIELKIGDILFVKKNNKYSEVTILNIQQGDKSIESANNGELGLKLDSSVKKNSKIWKKLI